MKIAIVMGTRPEIIKLSSIINKLNKKNSTLIFTGQHYDYDMSYRFLKELAIRNPEYKMKLRKLQNTTSDRATQTGEIIINLAKIFSKINPDYVMVQGDTNTVLAAVITAIKCNIPGIHVESGLRSHDWRMPEEHNRVAVDHISELLFAPTNYCQTILKNESVHGKIFVTGNTSIDAIEKYYKIAEKKSKIELNEQNYILVTLHRGENVDNKNTLNSILAALVKSNQKIIFPIHPRTLKRLHEFGFYRKIINSKNITLLPTLGYFDMIHLMKKCNFIVSDSGGIQEEATSPHIRKKVLIVRKTTDRPEAVKLGYSKLVGTDTDNILKSIKITSCNPQIISKYSPYGKGNASNKIIGILKKLF